MKPQVTINQNEDYNSNVSVNHDNDFDSYGNNCSVTPDCSAQTSHDCSAQTTPDWSDSIFPIPHLYREEFRKQAITPQHIKQTKRLFRDFHIDLPTDFKQIIKQFKYYYELENWRRYYIVNQLNQIEKETH